MGNVSADGKYLWLAARYDDVVYRFDTGSGEVRQIKVGAEPHGLTVWPQPGRYSLGTPATCAEGRSRRGPQRQAAPRMKECCHDAFWRARRTACTRASSRCRCCRWC